MTLNSFLFSIEIFSNLFDFKVHKSSKHFGIKIFLSMELYLEESQQRIRFYLIHPISMDMFMIIISNDK